jgi:hypothetical protein
MSNSYGGPLCPVTMNSHPGDDYVCDRCIDHVARYLAWYLTHDVAERDRISAGAWIANSSTHFRAMSMLVARRTELAQEEQS